MKHTFLILSLALPSVLAACQNAPHQKAEQTAYAIQNVMKTYEPPLTTRCQ